jgi:hypothetical protein
MESPNSCFTIDRALFVPRTLSWAESVMALFRDFCTRVRSRNLRSRCEARLHALALAHQHAHPIVARPSLVLRSEPNVLPSAKQAALTVPPSCG